MTIDLSGASINTLSFHFSDRAQVPPRRDCFSGGESNSALVQATV